MLESAGAAFYYILFSNYYTIWLEGSPARAFSSAQARIAPSARIASGGRAAVGRGRRSRRRAAAPQRLSLPGRRRPPAARGGVRCGGGRGVRGAQAAAAPLPPGEPDVSAPRRGQAAGPWRRTWGSCWWENVSAGGAGQGEGRGEAERPSEIGTVLWRREGRPASGRRARPRALRAPRPHLAPGGAEGGGRALLCGAPGRRSLPRSWCLLGRPRRGNGTEAFAPRVAASRPSLPVPAGLRSLDRGVWEPAAPLGQMRCGQRDGCCGGLERSPASAAAAWVTLGARRSYGWAPLLGASLKLRPCAHMRAPK